MMDAKENYDRVEKIREEQEVNSFLGITIGEDEYKRYRKMHPVELMLEIDRIVEIIKKKMNPLRSGTRVKWIINKQKADLEFSMFSSLINSIVRSTAKEIQEEIDKSSRKDEIQISLLNKYKYLYSYWWNRYYHINEFIFARVRVLTKIYRNREEDRKLLTKLIRGEEIEENLTPKAREVLKVAFELMMKGERKSNGK